MNMTKAQLQAVGHLMKNNSEGDKQYMLLSEDGFSGVYNHTESGEVNEIQKISRRVISTLADKGLITLVGKEPCGGQMLKAADHLIRNKELHKRGIEAFGERATYATLAAVAEKYYCSVEFERTPKLFKLIRLDGRAFSKPYIDVSEDGVKVTRLTDLSLGEWETEIANCIKRSELI